MQNNETIGISFEVFLCLLNNLPIPEQYKNRYDEQIVKRCFNAKGLDILKKIIISKCVAFKNTPVDFYDNFNKTISAKTIKTTKNKICPSKIGQTNKTKWINYFMQIDHLIPMTQVKQFVKQNLNIVLKTYLEHIFNCDILILYIFQNNEIIIYDQKHYADYQFNCKLAKDIELWNESISIKDEDNKTIGEFQIHNNRNCIKFRFTFNFINQKFLYTL